MEHVVPQENKMPSEPTFFQRYIWPSIVAIVITTATLIFGLGGTTQKLDDNIKEVEALRQDRKDFATKDDVRRVEEAVKDIQKDVKDILKEKR